MIPWRWSQYEKQRAELGDNPSDEVLLNTRLVPDPRKVKLRVYQTNSTHKSMSALRQGSMLLVKDVEFHSVEAQFHEAVFTHASTSPNQQLIASLDVARRQMELEGYGLVHNAIEVASGHPQAVAKHPLISKYFHILGADKMVPEQYRQSGFIDFLDPKSNWAAALRSMREDEFCLDPTRMTLVCGTAGFDGTQFKGMLAERYNIQLNKTSRNSVLLQSNINNTRSDVAHLIRVLVTISQRDRPAPCARRLARAAGIRGAGQEPDDRRAGPAELLALPRRVPEGCRQAHERGRHPRRLLCRLQRRGMRIHPPSPIRRSTSV